MDNIRLPRAAALAVVCLVGHLESKPIFSIS
jgi:hypothetical protein